MSFNDIRENKVIAKISGITVKIKNHYLFIFCSSVAHASDTKHFIPIQLGQVLK